tara:strand:- start:998 stop:1573 length:576 start_codon:yes stop_codon:yes gene_type:complete
MKKNKNLTEYIVPIFSLSNQKHEYSFEVSNEFFEAFEESIVKKGKFKVDVTLDRSETMIVAQLSIVGNAELVCDRSLDEFQFPIDSQERVIYKYEDRYEEIDDTLIHIPFGAESLDLSTNIYDLINVQIPMKKLHPRFVEESFDEDDDFEDEEESFLVYSSEDESNEEEDKKVDDSGDVDPRWSKLKDLNK